MGFETDFLELMKQTLTVEASTGLNKYGRPGGYGAATSVKCRVREGTEVVRDFNGEETISDVQAWCQGDVTAAETSRYTLPDGSTPPLVAVQKFPDESGSVHNTVLLFKRDVRGSGQRG